MPGQKKKQKEKFSPSFIRSALFVFLLVAVEVSSGTSAKDVKEKTSDAASAAVEYTKEQKDAFAQEMKQNLSKIDAEISALKGKASHATDEKLKLLDEKQKNMKRNLAELEKSTGKAWGRLRDGVTKAWSQLELAFDDARKEMKK